MGELTDWVKIENRIKGQGATSTESALAALARLEAREKLLLADNAALLDLIRRYRRGLPPFKDERGSTAPWVGALMDVDRDMDAALAQPHPGAALLEENKRLRADSERLGEARRKVNEHWEGACSCADAQECLEDVAAHVLEPHP